MDLLQISVAKIADENIYPRVLEKYVCLVTAMRMRNVTIFNFHGGWAVQMDFLFENCTF